MTSDDIVEPSGGAPLPPPGQGPTQPPTRRQRVLSSLRRRARAALEAPPPPPPAEPPPPVEAERTWSLTQMNPFAIGFFGTLGAMAAYFLAMMLGQLQSVLMIVLVSLFVALGLNPLVEGLTRRGLRRGLGVFLVALSVLSAIGLAGWAVVPIFTEQIETLIRNAPQYLENLRTNEQIANLDERFKIIEKATAYLNGGTLIDQVFGGIVGAGRLVANALFSLVITLVLTLYFLASLPSIKDTIYRLAPASQRPRVRYLADEMFRRIGGYLGGMFFIGSLAGTCAFIFMMLAGMAKYALALAVVVALCAFIPLVGANLAMLLVAIVAFSTIGPWHGLATIIYFQAYQQFEAYFLQPRVMKRSVDVPAPVVIVSALAGGLLLGVVGAIVAIPIAASVLLLYREVLIPRLDRS